MSTTGVSHRITVEHALRLTEAAFEAEGVRSEWARTQASHLVEAELRGHASHGLRRLTVLLERVRAGLIDPTTAPTLQWTADAALRVDGARGFGPVAAYRAIDALIERSKTTGIAVAALRRTHHLGMLAPYVEHISDNGCIGLVFTSTEGLVHPWHGSGALLGTNPLAVGVPVGEDEISLDMSTSSVSAGKILDHLERGLPLPEGWAVDDQGKPTSDPAVAINGAISPFGGSKGYALGLTLGAIVGLLTDTAYGPDVVGTLDSEHETTKGDVIIVIRLDALGQSASSDQLAAYLGLIRTSGVDGAPARIPGDRARESRAVAIAEGFDITDEVWQVLNSTQWVGGL